MTKALFDKSYIYLLEVVTISQKPERANFRSLEIKTINPFKNESDRAVF